MYQNKVVHLSIEGRQWRWTGKKEKMIYGKINSEILEGDVIIERRTPTEIQSVIDEKKRIYGLQIAAAEKHIAKGFRFSAEDILRKAESTLSDIEWEMDCLEAAVEKSSALN